MDTKAFIEAFDAASPEEQAAIRAALDERRPREEPAPAGCCGPFRPPGSGMDPTACMEWMAKCMDPGTPRERGRQP